MYNLRAGRPSANAHRGVSYRWWALLVAAALLLMPHSATAAQDSAGPVQDGPRQRLSIDHGWRFFKYASPQDADGLIYDVRPAVGDSRDDRPADAEPTAAVEVQSTREALKPWIMPTGNDFIGDPGRRHVRPPGSPGEHFSFVRCDFDDSSWDVVDLPHDWAIAGPFFAGADAEVGGGMGRLPSPGVAWYRKQLDIPDADRGRSVFLDVDGAMSYAMVWLNGKLVGGWPYGYASWRVDLTPYVRFGEVNQLAIRLDNPADSSRWYPGGGIYRHVWLTTANQIHVAHWGACVTAREVSSESATIDVTVAVDNDSDVDATVDLATEVYLLASDGEPSGDAVAALAPAEQVIPAGRAAEFAGTAVIRRPQLWGPPPSQQPNRYVAITTVRSNGEVVDVFQTPFGIRDVQFDPLKGVIVNGEPVKLRGVNLHHDLGALGAAFHRSAAKRQLETLREMGCNAIRTAHNPPAPELLELTDEMGLLVVDEVFDAWYRKKTPLDFHLIFADWHEQDLRAMVRRDRNHPSVILWSFGNEVGEQYTGDEGAAVAQGLHDIVKDEDPTRPTTTAMNYAKPNMPLPKVPEVIALNYQGEGIRNAPAYAGLRGISTPPLYPAFRDAFPDKLILSSENAAALSTRGEYLFPVYAGTSAPVKEGMGGDSTDQYVSAYELYSADFGSSADKVFASLDRHPFVAGGFVWSGWDYLGEPTPYYGARSSYFGIIDLAGFKKDRFYLYQARWRPELPLVHILPHWNWPGRVGERVPVHVFTSGDEVELFLNGRSLGRKQLREFEYRLRWDDVVYEPGELRAVAYKDGAKWAQDVRKTTGPPTRIELQADRDHIDGEAGELAFVTVRITDGDGLVVPDAKTPLRFTIEGPGEIVATDNGDPTDFVPFPSPQRAAFNGLCLVIVKPIHGQRGVIRLVAEADGLPPETVRLTSQ